MEGNWRLEEWQVDEDRLRPPQADGGRRTYQMRLEGDKLILDSDNGRWMLIFDGDTLTYLDNGKPLRKWRRMAAEQSIRGIS